MYFQNVAGGNAVDMTNDVASATLTVGGRTITGAPVSADVLYFSIGDSNPVTLSRDQLTSASVNLAFVDNDDRTPANIELIIGNGAFTPVSGTAQGIRAISESTGVELAGTVITTSGAVESQAHLLAQSKPVVSVNAGAVSNSVLYGFSVTADANGYVDLTGFDFAMPGIPGVEYSNIELRINSTSGTIIGTFADVAAGAPLVSTITLEPAYNPAGYRLSAGTTVNFFLTATVDDNARTNSYTRNVKLNNIVFADNSGNAITNASAYDNTGLEAANVSYNVTK